jgi:hypothetical protein
VLGPLLAGAASAIWPTSSTSFVHFAHLLPGWSWPHRHDPMPPSGSPIPPPLPPGPPDSTSLEFNVTPFIVSIVVGSFAMLWIAFVVKESKPRRDDDDEEEEGGELVRVPCICPVPDASSSSSSADQVLLARASASSAARADAQRHARLAPDALGRRAVLRHVGRHGPHSAHPLLRPRVRLVDVERRLHAGVDRGLARPRAQPHRAAPCAAPGAPRVPPDAAARHAEGGAGAPGTRGQGRRGARRHQRVCADGRRTCRHARRRCAAPARGALAKLDRHCPCSCLLCVGDLRRRDPAYAC